MNETKQEVIQWAIDVCKANKDAVELLYFPSDDNFIRLIEVNNNVDDYGDVDDFFEFSHDDYEILVKLMSPETLEELRAFYKDLPNGLDINNAEVLWKND